MSFSLELHEALTFAEGTKLASLVDQFRPLKGSFHLWLLATHSEYGRSHNFSDAIFPYDDVKKVICTFFKKCFSSGPDHHLIEEKVTKSQAVCAAVSYHDGEKMTGFKILSCILFQELTDRHGFYIPYLATAADKFTFKGCDGDNRPWRRRGLTSMLLKVVQAACQLHCNLTSIYLECREPLVPTYTKFGFSRCDCIDKSWEVPDNVSMPQSSDLVRMWNGSRIVATAACSGTASLCHSRPFRSCCRDLAFKEVLAPRLFDYDVFLFEYIDSYEQPDDGFIARCTMCADRSKGFSLSTFHIRFYEYASGHMQRCSSLRKDAKRRNLVRTMHANMKDEISIKHGEASEKLACRTKWLNVYCRAVSESSCIPGCGVPCDPKNRASERLLLTLPLRYSMRLARKTPSTSVGILNSSDKMITHLQYSTNGKFIGYNKTGSAEVLTEDFVKSEFHEYFVLYVVNLCPRKLGVPVGTSSRSGIPVSTSILQADASVPRVTQQLHRDTCVFSSAVSAFMYFGDQQAVKCLRDRLFISTLKADRLGFLVRTLEHRSLNYQPTVFRQRKLNVLANLSPFPTVIKLCGQDGGCFHVVTVVGRVLFDSNCSDPLPLCQAALDWCCSYSSGERNQFAYVVRAYRFVHQKPREYWRLTI